MDNNISYNISYTNGAVFVYSGTGNNLAVAKQIAAVFNLKIIHITDELTKNPTNFEGNTGVFCFPTYGLGLPLTARNFIKNNHFKFKYMAVLTAMGSNRGGALAEAIRLFIRRGQTVHYSKGIKSIENFVHLFGYGPFKRSEFKINRQRKITNQIIDDMKSQKTNSKLMFRPLSFLIGALTRWGTRVFMTRYKFLDTCNSCGVCVKVCPANALSINKQKNPKPKMINKKCDACQGCLQLCPQKAIKKFRVQPHSMRYIHTDVVLEELFKR